MTNNNPEASFFWDEEKKKWLVDDFGRYRDATPEEIEAHVSNY